MTPTTHRLGIDAILDRLADQSILGPLRAHRFGHDHDVDPAEDDVLAAYREQAATLHERLAHDNDIFVAEFLGATGSGKTRLIEGLLDRAPPSDRIGVIVGDVAGEDDATRLEAYDVTVTTINTGKECHLDPTLLEEGLSAFDLETLDRLYVENVGNMVCPADFPLGAQARVLVVSTTEGDDVVNKHPLLFQAADLAVINKTDIADAVDADLDRMTADVDRVAPDIPVLETSAKTGAGLDALATALEQRGHDHAHHATPE
ncbi:MAG: hydrogenase nickel incorporation protein HypB [Halodesulfurarchaeum sp.]